MKFHSKNTSKRSPNGLKLNWDHFFHIRNSFAMILWIFQKFVVSPIFWNVSVHPTQKMALTTNSWKIHKIIAKRFILWKKWSTINLGPFGEHFEVKNTTFKFHKKSKISWVKHACRHTYWACQGWIFYLNFLTQIVFFHEKTKKWLYNRLHNGLALKIWLIKMI